MATSWHVWYLCIFKYMAFFTQYFPIFIFPLFALFVHKQILKLVKSKPQSNKSFKHNFNRANLKWFKILHFTSVNKQNLLSIQHLVISNKQQERCKNWQYKKHEQILLPVSHERVYQARIDRGIRSNSAGL